MARQTDDSGPNLLGEKGVQEKPELGIRSPVKKGTPRGTLQKIPQRVLTDLRRRIAEVKFAEAVIKAGGKMDPDAAIKEASKKKYGGLIDSTRINKIHADPNKFIKQLGVDPTNLKTGEKLPSVSDLRRYVRNSLDNVESQVGRLNKHLFPEGVPLDHIVRSIHFGHGQALGSAGPHVGDEGLAQLPMENIGQGKLSGPSKGELDLETGRYKVNDAYSAIGHPQFWDEVLSNFIMGRKHVPVLVELTPEGKNRVIHQGHDPDRVIIEEGEIKLRDAVIGKTKGKVNPEAEADHLSHYGEKHQQKVLESSERNLTRQRPQEIVEVKSKWPKLTPEQQQAGGEILTEQGSKLASSVDLKFNVAETALNVLDHMDKGRYGEALIEATTLTPAGRTANLVHSTADSISRASTGQSLAERIADAPRRTDEYFSDESVAARVQKRDEMVQTIKDKTTSITNWLQELVQ